MAIVTANVTRQPYIVDSSSVDRDNGHQIDWDNVTDVDSAGRKRVLAGTPVGSLLGGGKVSPRVATTNPAIGLLEFTAIQAQADGTGNQNALSGHGVIVGGVFFENLLPTATGTSGQYGSAQLPAAVKTELAAAGTGFAFKVYRDSSATLPV